MVPVSITKLLNRLHRRDQWLSLVWVLARVLCLCLALVVVFGLIDWLVDLWVDTPGWLHLGLLVTQILVWTLALIWIASVLFKRRNQDALALWVERSVPSLRQRVIATLQLNRQGANTLGMSPDLIRAVTQQAEHDVRGVDLGQVCNNRRLRLAGQLAFPTLAVVALLYLLAPGTCQALVARMFLQDVAIPRQVQLHPIGRSVWPAGEDGVLHFRVKGLTSKTTGLVLIQPEEGNSFWLPLTHEQADKGAVIYSAQVPGADVSFAYLAWLGDQRLREPGRIRYAPRPLAESLQAWVLLPSRLGKRSDGTPYEKLQKGGDVVYRLPDSRVRLEIETQVDLQEAKVRILGPEEREVSLEEIDGKEARGSFDLRSGDRAYEVHLVSSDGFACVDRPRRSIRELPLESPVVEWVLETMWKKGDEGRPEDHEVEGIPVLMTENPEQGRQFHLAYRCRDPFGLSHARLRFRVLRTDKELQGESGDIDSSEFQILPLGPQPGKPATDQANREFSTLPAQQPNSLPGTEGGGEYDFRIDGIPDGKGGYVNIRLGNRIQYYVEVFGKADPTGTPGRSPIREKQVVGLAAFGDWLDRKDDLKERTRALEEEQRKVRPGQPK